MKTSKYIACLDYKASYAPLTLDYKVLNAANILDAMNEAEQYLDKEKVYLITVMERKLLSMNVGTYLMEVYCLTDTLKGRAVQSGLIPHPKKFARKEV